MRVLLLARTDNQHEQTKGVHLSLDLVSACHASSEHLRRRDEESGDIHCLDLDPA